MVLFMLYLLFYFLFFFIVNLASVFFRLFYWSFWSSKLVGLSINFILLFFSLSIIFFAIKGIKEHSKYVSFKEKVVSYVIISFAILSFCFSLLLFLLLYSFM